MLRRKVVEITKRRRPVKACTVQCLEQIRTLPHLPVFSETLLSIELAAGQSPIELSRISSLIRSDLGAAMQVLRLAGLQSAEGGHFNRIEDCIAGFGLDACLEAMSKRVIPRTRRYARIADAWEHAKTIAEKSSQLAEAGGTSTHEAGLAGLCHEIDRLPKLLGWGPLFPPASDMDCAGLAIAEAWSLPRCVREYFSGRLQDETNSPWSAIVDRAHHTTRSATVLCM